ncbi:MAG: S-layer homology domain-containing protein [Ruminiclostridium sp.]|nr:S-layer homology domain-containing protein [Ruminiclostridium sp.]
MIMQKHRGFRVLTSIILAFLIFINAANLPVYADVVDNSGNNSMSVTNGFVMYSVSSENGRFTIKTDQGATNRDDSNQKLLFEDKKPDTSFTSFKIDGNDYIFGNSYGFMGVDTEFTSPEITGKSNSSVWTLGDIQIVQKLELISDPDNPNVGNVKITYEVTYLENSKPDSKKSVTIGARILLDTMLGSNDGAPIFIPGEQQPITNERKLTGVEVPQYWRGADNVFSPKVVSYGFTDGWGNQCPDEMIIGHWSGLSQSKWEYEVNSGLNFSGKENQYGSADSAVALYWNPIVIEQGKTKVFETYYGIGNFSNINDKAKYKLNVYAPDKLTVVSYKDSENKVQKKYEEFEIVAEVDNTFSDASNLTNVTASLILDEGLELAGATSNPGNEIPYKSVEVIKRNEIYTFKWKVKASNSDVFTSKQYRVDINCDNHTEPVSKGGYAILPGIKGEAPKTTFISISPSTLYHKGAKSFTINGTGFDVYMNKNRWTMSIINSKSKAVFQVPRESIIVKDNTITADINEDFAEGTYKLKIDHMDFGVQEVPGTLKMSKDTQYQSKSYGVLYVKKTEDSGDYKYDIGMAASADDLAAIEKRLYTNEEVILDIKGSIREFTEDGNKVYRVYDKAVINSVVNYKGEPLKIRKIDDLYEIDGEDTITIEGNGDLAMENEFCFWKWDFEISIVDGENYITEFAEEDDDECNVEVEFTGLGKIAKYIAGFVIQIKNAVILKHGVSLGGSIYISLPNMNKENEINKEEEDDFPGIGVDISKVLYGMEDEEDDFGFLGLEVTTQIKAPEDMVPIPWISKGFEASLTINTIENMFSFEGEADIKICEAYVNLTLMKLPGAWWKWLPDDLVIAGTFDPGFALGPTGVFLNKVGGGVEDMYGTLTGDGSLPPLQVILIAGVNFAKVVELEAKLSISKNGFKFEGEGEIAKLKALKEVEVALTWAKPRSFELGATLSLLSCIEGNISIYIDSESWCGSVTGNLFIPKWVPIVGGKSVYKTSMGVSNEKIWGPVRVVGIPVMVTYYWGGAVDFEVPKPWGSTASNITLPTQPGIYATTISEDDGDAITMVVGGNIRIIGSSMEQETVYASKEGLLSVPSLNDKRLVYATTDDRIHYMDIQDQEIVLMQFKFEGNVPDITVYKPDNSIYPLVQMDEGSEMLDQDANMRVQIISPEDSSSGKEEKYIFISVINPENGQWRVESDTSIQSALMEVDPVPVLNSVTVSETENENEFNVAWEAEHFENTTANIYLAKDQSSAGMLLASLSGMEGQSTFQIPIGTEEGSYYIRVTIDKGNAGYNSMYADKKVYVTDPYKPSAVTSAQVEPYGDGFLKVNWDKVEEEGVDGYLITCYDKNDEIVQSIGHVTASAGDTEVILGGRYQMQGIEETAGLEIGKEYYVGITTSKKVGDDESFTTHLSDITYSEQVMLPVPNPADITISYGNNFKDGVNNERNATKISNEKTARLYFIANQSDVNTEVLVNGLPYKSFEGKEHELEITVEDGDYTVDFVTTNGNKDTTAETIIFTIDTTAPVLMVDSPVQGQASENGVILAKGIAEKGSAVKINGTNVVPDQNGAFEKAITLGTNLKEAVTIEVSDRAGNTTVYQTEVANDTVDTIEGIFIRPVINEMIAGESQEFEVVAVDGLGREIVMKENVEWSLLIGDSLAQVNEDGVLRTFSHGDLILMASYYVTEDYAYEDAIPVKVLPNPDDVPELIEIPGEDEEPEPDEEDPGEDEQPGSGEEEPGEDEQPGSGEEEPGEDEQPGSGEEEPGEDEQPGSGEEEPGEDEQPGSGEEEPGEDEEPAPGEEEPGKDEEPAPGEEEPGKDEEPEPGEEELGKDEEPEPGEEEPGEDEEPEPGKEDTGDDKESAPSNDEPGEEGEGDDDNNSRSEIDIQLEKILFNIIQTERNIIASRITDVYPGQSKSLTLNSGARLDIPAGSVGQRDKLLIGIVRDTSLYIDKDGIEEKLLSPIYELQFARSNEGLNEPVRLSFPYDGAMVDDTWNIGFYYYNEAFGKWQYIGGVYSHETKEISVLLNHFCKYALLLDKTMVNFSDIRGRASEKDIKGLYSLGVVNGIPDGTGFKFEPERGISRLEFAKMVLEILLQTKKIQELPMDAEVNFVDKNSIPEWGKKYAALAAQNNIIQGRKTEKGLMFDSNTPITRVEAAVIIGRTIEETVEAVDSDFKDKKRFPAWAIEQINKLWSKKIITGDSDNSFVPNRNLTREEAATIISNWINTF